MADGYTGKSCSWSTPPAGISQKIPPPYRLVIHCGGCMLNDREVAYRRKTAADAGVPFTNYGITIAHLKGILKRSLELFPQLHQLISS